VFYVHELTDTSRAVDIHRGKAKWTVPADTMHSFAAPNNRIVWVLHVHGHLHGWPDVKDEYVLKVAPLAQGARAFASDDQDDGEPRLAAPLAGRGPGSDEESAPQAGRLNGENSRWT
jgi:hypothetical protein